MNQGRCLPVAAIDRLYEEHVHQFLNVSAAASRIQREARAARKAKQEKADADQLSADLQAAQVITGTKQSTGSIPVVPPPDAVADERASVSQGEGSTTVSSPSVKSARNHRRSRHMGRGSDGVPLPTTMHVDQSADDDVDGRDHPLPGFDGRIASDGRSWGTSMGYEGRERGERG